MERSIQNNMRSIQPTVNCEPGTVNQKKMETILIIEDDPAMLRGLCANVTASEYACLSAADGERGLNLALDEKPDLILLDIMLPEINGYEICRILREQKLDMPIIMLTAKGEESDIILGLNLGADDYVTKPFSIHEVMARINALLRRRRQEPSVTYRFGPFLLDVEAHKLAYQDHPNQAIELTPKEYRVLQFLVEREGKAVTRDHLLNHVWGYNALAGHGSVNRCMATLRSKIEPDPHRPVYIHTLRDIGYKFEPPQEG